MQGLIPSLAAFRYFDARDLLGFVDGTANPTSLDLPTSAVVGDEDPDFVGGSYVVVQKYLYDLSAWASKAAATAGRAAATAIGL